LFLITFRKGGLVTIVMHGGDIRERVITGYHEAAGHRPEVARHGAPRDREERDQLSHPSQGAFAS
jgi:hypothetical protein